MGGGFISRADSLITVNFSWIFFPQARENPCPPKRGLSVSPPTKSLWLGLGATGGAEKAGPVLLPLPAPQQVPWEAAPASLAGVPSLLVPPPLPWAAPGATVTSGSGVGKGLQGRSLTWERGGAQLGPGRACPEVTLPRLRPSKPSASSALLVCDLGHCTLLLCAQLALGPWVLRLPGSPTTQDLVTVAV